MQQGFLVSFFSIFGNWICEELEKEVNKEEFLFFHSIIHSFSSYLYFLETDCGAHK